jgi:hypothetical protein
MSGDIVVSIAIIMMEVEQTSFVGDQDLIETVLPDIIDYQ